MLILISLFQLARMSGSWKLGKVVLLSCLPSYRRLRSSSACLGLENYRNQGHFNRSGCSSCAVICFSWKHVMVYMHTEANLHTSLCATVVYDAVLSYKWLCSRNSEISTICGCWNLRYELLAGPCFLFLLNEASIKDSRLSPSHVEVLQNLP